MGIGVLSSEVIRPGRNVDHSPPSSTKGNKEWSYTSTPLYAFMAWAGSTPFLWSTIYVCTRKVQLMKSKIKHAGTWSVATWQPRRLCHRPAVPPATFVYCDLIAATNIRLFKNAISTYVFGTVHHCDSLRIRDQLDVTSYCFISLLLCSTCFGH